MYLVYKPFVLIFVFLHLQKRYAETTNRVGAKMEVTNVMLRCRCQYK